MLLEAFLSAAAVIFLTMTALWLISVKRRDVTVVDVFWGLGFVLAAWIYRAFGPEAVLRQQLVLALVTLWGLRLAGHLGWRSHGRGEDRRYRAMRERGDPGFWWKSYFQVFLLQGALLLAISLPHLVLQAAPSPSGWRLVDSAALGLWALGFFYETVGDYQLARFRAEPRNQGKVLTSGLWATTRHPNYFGDAAQWWAYGLFATAAPGGFYTLPSVLLMTWLLLKVSGVALLEKDIAQRRPEYRDYARRTPAFVPFLGRLCKTRAN